MCHKPCPPGHSPLLAGKPWEGWELVLTAFENAQGGQRTSAQSSSAPNLQTCLHTLNSLLLHSSQDWTKGLPILSYSTQGRPVASQGSGGGCNLTTFLSVSNLSWLKKRSSGPVIVLSTIAAPGEVFLYLFVLSATTPSPLPTTAACKLNLSHQIKRKVGLGKPPSKAETVSALS